MVSPQYVTAAVVSATSCSDERFQQSDRRCNASCEPIHHVCKRFLIGSLVVSYDLATPSPVRGTCLWQIVFLRLGMQRKLQQTVDYQEVDGVVRSHADAVAQSAGECRHDVFHEIVA